jgi:hypothetical protein
MDVNEALDFANKLITNKTKKPLTDTEIQVFIGSWQSLTYGEIDPLSPGYLEKDVGPKLWKKLSEVLKVKVTKKTFRGIIEGQLREQQSHVAAKPQPQKSVSEIPISNNSDFVGREDAIAHQLLKEEIDKMFASEPYIQKVLKLVSYKSRQIKAESYTEHKLSAIRAYYLHLYSNSGIDLYLAFSLDSSIKYNPSLMLDLNLAKTLSCFYDFPCGLSHASYIADFLELAIKQLDHNKINLQQSQKDQLLSELRELRQQLPSELELVPSSPNTKNDEDRTRFEKFIVWWQNEGQNWAEELRTVMITYRGISQDFWLLDKQKLIVLHHYYSFNKSLVACLRNTSDDIRSHIEDTLLLPIAEIEKRPFKN